jgi:hypothetical protein
VALSRRRLLSGAGILFSLLDKAAEHGALHLVDARIPHCTPVSSKRRGVEPAHDAAGFLGSALTTKLPVARCLVTDNAKGQFVKVAFEGAEVDKLKKGNQR